MNKQAEISAIKKTYPEFYGNDFIKFIAENPKWSISDKNKRPISMCDLKAKLNNQNLNHPLYGASQYNPNDMTTLDGLLNLLPNASNHAYQLNAKRDHWLVLDIEKSCPDKLKKRFLSLPYLYGEHSLSGKGIHLILTLPKNWQDFKEYQDMPKMQEKHKWFEILMNHWVTFTRNSLDKPINEGDGTLTVDTVFSYLAKETKPEKHIDIKTLVHKPKIPHEKFIINLMRDHPYNKDLTDFYNDESRWEYANAMYIIRQFMLIRKQYLSLHKVAYTDDQIVYLTYDILKERLPYRPKHDDIRQNMPWLLFLSQSAYARYLDDLAKQKNKSKNK